MKQWTQLFLRTETEEEFVSVCAQNGLVTPDGEVIENTNEYQMIRLGTLYKPTGETEINSDGDEVPVFEKLTGYHVNVLAKDPDFLGDIQITVDAPLVVWSI